MKYAEINLRVEQEKLIMKNLKALSRMTMRAAIGLYTFQLTAIPYRLTIDFAYTITIYKFRQCSAAHRRTQQAPTVQK